MNFFYGWRLVALREKICGAICLALIGSVVCAQQNPPSRGREVTKLYAQYCADCHGGEMNGGSAPGLVGGNWRHGGDDASIAASIRSGFPNNGMPAMGKDFNGPEIRALVVYIRELGTRYETAHTTYHEPHPNDIVPTEKARYRLESVVESGLEVPWAIAFLPDGRMLVTERPGRLRIIEHGKLLPEPVRGIPEVYGGEGGLLDVVLHPDYSKPGNDWIYLSYGDKSPGGLAMSAVIRGRLRNGTFIDQQQIYKAAYSLYRKGGQRFGSRLVFDGQSHLFFSIGDRACPGDEQDLTHSRTARFIALTMTEAFPKTTHLCTAREQFRASGRTVTAMRKASLSIRFWANYGNRNTGHAAAMN